MTYYISDSSYSSVLKIVFTSYQDVYTQYCVSTLLKLLSKRIYEVFASISTVGVRLIVFEAMLKYSNVYITYIHR